jgi:hypothetical protein
MIRTKDEKMFLSALPNLRTGKRHHFRHQGGIWRVLLFSMIFSSGLSGAVYLALFWFQSGRIARDILEQLQRKGIQRGIFRIILVNAFLKVMKILIDIPVELVPVYSRNGR